MPTEGVDYAWSRPDPVALAAAGKRFVSRYVGPGSEGKHLTRAEADALIAAGLAVVSNAEGAADGALGGFNAGVDHARSAHAMAVQCGMPPDRPIYFSVDFQPTDTQLKGPVADYLLGAASVLGAGNARVGVYGSYKTVAFCAANGLAQWLWQTYAWSSWRDPDGVTRVHWHPAAHVQQYFNGWSIGGVGSIDLDRATVADFGQWPRMEVSDVGFLARDAAGRYYRCEGGWSFPISAEAVPHIIYMAKQAPGILAHGVGPEWTSDGWVRLGWSEAVFGPLPVLAADVAAVKAGLAAVASALADLAAHSGMPAEQIEAIRAAAEAGARAGAVEAAPAVAEAVRPVVDSELDEAFAGADPRGVDNDPPPAG